MYILDSSCGDTFVKGAEVLVKILARLERIENFLVVDFPAPSFFEHTSNISEHGEDGRSRSHLDAETVDHDIWTPPTQMSPCLSLCSVCCEGEYELTDIELNYITFSYRGCQLVTITGPPHAGAGTSLVFEAILGEVPLNRGKVEQDGKIAYVGQRPWIFSGTLRENILFGEPYREERFLSVIRACKLEQDIKLLCDGDMTIVGEGGIKLNLGQWERLNLARAAYSSASIILLDNPVSHVDIVRANEIFEECIQGFLAPRLRLLITRRPDFLARSSHVLFMTDGIIVREGSLAKIQESGEDLTWLRIDTRHEQDNEEKLELSDRIQTASQVTVRDEMINTEEGLPYLKYTRQVGLLPQVLSIGILLIAAPGGMYQRTERG